MHHLNVFHIIQDKGEQMINGVYLLLTLILKSRYLLLVIPLHAMDRASFLLLLGWMVGKAAAG